MDNFNLAFFLLTAWLNNCVGHANHRYFYLYMLYTVIGSLFLIIFGIELAYKFFWIGDDEGWIESEPLEGHPIAYNLTGHIVRVVRVQFNGDARTMRFIVIFFSRLK